MVWVVTSGASPNTTSTGPRCPLSWPSAALAACPVPSGLVWTTVGWGAKAAATALAPGATTTNTLADFRRATFSSTWRSMGQPASGWRTLGVADFMRVPAPAASTTTAIGDFMSVPMPWGWRPGKADVLRNGHERQRRHPHRRPFRHRDLRPRLHPDRQRQGHADGRQQRAGRPRPAGGQRGGCADLHG